MVLIALMDSVIILFISNDHTQIKLFFRSLTVNLQGFPQVLRTCGGGGGERGCQNIGGACGELNMLSENNCEGVHLILTLPAISLPASKFTKYKLLHTYFSRILARFSVIIYFTFSRNHFMEGCFMF